MSDRDGSDNKRTKTCPICHGSGQHPESSTHCPLCLGVGIELEHQGPVGSDNLRDELKSLLEGEGLSAEPETYDSDIHSWRCSHPDVYGRCFCLRDMIDRLEELVERRVAEATGRLGGQVLTHVEVWKADGLDEEEVERRVAGAKVEAWDEGADAGACIPQPPNPYRALASGQEGSND